MRLRRVGEGPAAPPGTDQDKRINPHLFSHVLAEIMSRDQGTWQAGGFSAEISKDPRDPCGSKVLPYTAYGSVHRSPL